MAEKKEEQRLKENIRALGDLLADLSQSGLLVYSENEPLAPLSTFKIGGKADYVVYPLSQSGLIATVQAAKQCGIRYGLFGNGSNLLFADEGFRGAAIFTTKMNKVSREGNLLIAEAGASLTGLAVTAMKAGLSGLEFAYGIPGSVGGAVYMNAGAYDGEIASVVTKSSYWTPDLPADEVAWLEGEAQGFGYRTSAYQESDKLILSAAFALKEGDPAEIRAKMDDFMARRKSKQPLEYPSAGSAFKRYPGYFTGKLIEDAGLKGLTVGGAQVSEKHAGFVINRGGATAKDVLTLIEQIRSIIYDKNGIRISPEVQIIPADGEHK